MTNSLGSYPNELILSKLQPSYWFSAHLHVHYAAIVDHEMFKNGTYPPATQAILSGQSTNHNQHQEPVVENPDEIKIDIDANPDEIEISLSDEEEKAPEAVETPKEPKLTKFLSLDKCLPRRQFLQVQFN
jgi:lariat debranching enzyme